VREVVAAKSVGGAYSKDHGQRRGKTHIAYVSPCSEDALVVLDEVHRAQQRETAAHYEKTQIYGVSKEGLDQLKEVMAETKMKHARELKATRNLQESEHRVSAESAPLLSG
jgi:hypothetical protein